MKYSELFRDFIRDYFLIFGILIIATVLLSPQVDINRDYILLAMAFAVVGNLPSLVLWSGPGLLEKAMRVRMAIHFILLEIFVLVFGGFTGIVSAPIQYLVLGIEVAIIYIIVKFIGYRGDMNTAKKINEELKKIKETEESE